MTTACALYDRWMRHPKISCNFLSHVTASLSLLLSRRSSKSVCVVLLVRATQFEPLHCTKYFVAQSLYPALLMVRLGELA